MTTRNKHARETTVTDAAFHDDRATPQTAGAQIAPGEVLDPETRQPMAIPGGAARPPSAPPKTLGQPADDQ